MQLVNALFTDEELKTDEVLRYFDYRHLPEDLQKYSRPFYNLAAELVRNTPRCPQRTIALNKLLEAKDCAVRAALYTPITY
jgi:hypothetical protein